MAKFSQNTISVIACLSFTACTQAGSQDNQKQAVANTDTPTLVQTKASDRNDDFSKTFETWVDGNGKMSLPDDYRSNWVLIGTWSIAGENEADGIHLVYTQPGVAAQYRKTGQFPDGAILVKELLSTISGDYTTGHVSYAGEISGWFMMVKESKKRFSENRLWGNGWGWAYFDTADRKNTTTEEFRTECLGCHIPARKNDWVFTEAYPLLK